MAIAFDASSSIAVGTGDRSWTHTPVGTPRGALVFVVHEQGTDNVVGVTYGGTAMVEVALSPVLHTTPETGAVHAFFLGSSVPAGGVSVAVDVDDATDWFAAAFTVTAAANTIIHDTSFLDSGAIADPSVSLTITAQSFVAGALYSGIAAPTSIAAGANTTEVVEADLGADSGSITRGSALQSANFTYGWTVASDDAAVLAVAVIESGTTIVDGDGASTGTGASSVVTAAVSAGVTASAGVGATTTAAVALWAGVTAATGVGATSTVSAALWAGVTASTGVAADSVIGAAIVNSGGVSTGLATALGTATNTEAVDGTATGIAASSITGAAFFSGIGAANGAAADIVTSASIYTADGASTGLATPTGVTIALWNTAGNSTGLATDSIVSGTISAAPGSSQGLAADNVVSGAIAASISASNGTSTSLGDGIWIALADGASAGVSTNTGLSAFVSTGVFSSLGTSQVTCVPVLIYLSLGNSIGLASTSIDGVSVPVFRYVYNLVTRRSLNKDTETARIAASTATSTRTWSQNITK